MSGPCKMLLLACLGLLLLGCQSPRISQPIASQIPVPTDHALKTQQKMQAVQHWELLAEDVDCKIDDYLESQHNLPGEDMYLVPGGNTPFEKTFYDLLLTQLVDKGVPVSRQKGSPLTLSFDLELVRHSKRVIQTETGVYSSLAPGVYVQRNKGTTWSPEQVLETEKQLANSQVNVDAGAYTTFEPAMEVVITTSLTKNDRYLMRDSSVYYINEKDWNHYEQRTDLHDPQTVNYSIVPE